MKVDDVWSQFATAAYVSPSPQIKYPFNSPQAPRADTDPAFNNQPWYHGSGNYAIVDQTWKDLSHIAKGRG